MNSALVKYYFGNKAGMLTALLDRDMVAIVRSVDALMAKDDMPPEEKLRRHISRCIDTYYAVPYLNRLLMRLVRDSDDGESQRIADKYLTPLRVAYERLISAGVARKIFRPVDPQLFYFTVTGAADRFFRASGAAPLLWPGHADRAIARPVSRTHRRFHHGRDSCPPLIKASPLKTGQNRAADAR